VQQHIIYESLKAKKQSHQCGFAVLADPDKTSVDDTVALADLCNEAGVDYLFLGGSLLMQTSIDATISQFKKASNIPVILFPGSPAQVSPDADALLYLSLISGRNPELLIGQHVTSAPLVKKSGLEVISTGYILIDGGTTTTVSYISNTIPIPADKPDIALCTAWAGEMLGQHVIYMDAGSGAKNKIPVATISLVSQNIGIPLITGGGITNAEKAYETAKAGANVIVVGNAIEKDPKLIAQIAKAIAKANAETGQKLSL